MSQLDFFAAPSEAQDEKPPRSVINNQERKELEKRLTVEQGKTVSLGVGFDYVVAKIGNKYFDLTNQNGIWQL